MFSLTHEELKKKYNSYEKISGIYFIYKEIPLYKTNKYMFGYIGQSIDCIRRIVEHLSGGIQDDNSDIYKIFQKDLQSNFNKYKILILEEIDSQDTWKLQERERYWIKKLKTMYPYGFNGNNGGDLLPGHICYNHNDFINVKIDMFKRGTLEEYQRKAIWIYHPESGEIRDLYSNNIYVKRNFVEEMYGKFGWIVVRYDEIKQYVYNDKDHSLLKIKLN